MKPSFLLLTLLAVMIVSPLCLAGESADLFAPDLSNADYPEGVWSVTDGVLTATKDQCIWTKDVYDDFILDLQFKTAEGTNSGVIASSKAAAAPASTPNNALAASPSGSTGTTSPNARCASPCT